MDNALICQLAEQTEAEAIWQMHSSVPDIEMRMCRGSVKRFGNLTAVRTDIFPGFSVNRVMGFADYPDIELIKDIVKFYEGREGIFALQIPPHLVSKEFSQELSASKFYLKNSWARFWRDTLPMKQPDTSLHVREISEPDEAEQFSKLATTIFDFPKELKPLVSSVFKADNWKYFLAFDMNKPVATGLLFTNGKVAWNSFATTLPEYRGKGAQSALLSARIDAAREAGCEYITTETHIDNASYRNMLRSGHVILYERPNFVYGETIQ